MSNSPPKTLSCPPFPTLKWDEFCWIATDTLPEWAGAQERLGAYTSESRESASSGAVRLIVNTEDEKPTPPTTEQIAAYDYLKSKGPSIAAAILKRVFEEYPKYREDFSHWPEDEVAELFPEIQQAEELKNLIGLGNIHFLTVAKDGMGYLGFEFGCDWEEEHGLGVMMHKDRIVDIGGADTAFLEWIAENDA